MATGPLAHLSGANGADVRQEGAQTIGTAEGGGEQTRRAGACNCPDHLRQTARKSINKPVLACSIWGILGPEAESTLSVFFCLSKGNNCLISKNKKSYLQEERWEDIYFLLK